MLQISGFSAGLIIGITFDMAFPMTIVPKLENNSPAMYTRPLKSWLKIDDRVKKHTRINGAKRKNKYENATIFNSIILFLDILQGTYGMASPKPCFGFAIPSLNRIGEIMNLYLNH